MANSDYSVLITGASGFIGSNLTRRLVELGFNVHLLLRPNSNKWRLQNLLSKISVHEGDVVDPVSVRAIFQKVKPRYFYHLSTYGAYEAQANPLAILNTNILGSYNVFSAALDSQCEVAVNVGSSSEYGYKSEPMKETDRLDPNSYYAVGKAAQSDLMRYIASIESKTAFVSFRLFSVYGPWEQPGRLFPTLIFRARANLPLKMVNRETVRDFVYIDDVVNALADPSPFLNYNGQIFNLGSGTQTSLSHVAELILRTLKSKSEVVWGGMPPRRWDTNRWQADISKTQECLRWSPKTSLETGIARMSEWMETAGNAYAG